MGKPFAIEDLLRGSWRTMEFEFFREGIEICWLIQGEPAVALLRYAPGAKAPMHVHSGLETVIVLEGAQSDQNGDYATGAVIFNPEGTKHSVWSPGGCVVLIQWERPVIFLDEET